MLHILHNPAAHMYNNNEINTAVNNNVQIYNN